MTRLHFHHVAGDTWAICELTRQDDGAWFTTAFYELERDSTKANLRKFARRHLGHRGRIHDAPPNAS